MHIDSIKLFGITPKKSAENKNGTKTKGETFQSGSFSDLNALKKTGVVGVSSEYKNDDQRQIDATILNFRKANNAAKVFLRKAALVQKNILDDASNVLSMADEAQGKYTEMLGLYNAGAPIASLGDKRYEITRNADGNAMMDEYTQDGTLLSTTYFEKGLPVLYVQGAQELPDGTTKVDLEIDYKDAKPLKYTQGGRLLPNGECIVEKEIEFANGKPRVYRQGQRDYLDDVTTVEKIIHFDGDMPIKYEEDATFYPDSSFISSTRADLEDGEIISYAQDSSETANGRDGFKRRILFENGKLALYQEDFEKRPDYSYEFSKSIDFENGREKTYMEGFEELSDGPSRIDKMIKLENKLPKSVIFGLDFGVEKHAEKIFEDVNGIWVQVKKNN